MIGLQIAGLVSDLPRYEATIRGKVQSAKSGTIDWLSGVFKQYSREIEEAAKETTPSESQTQGQTEEGPKPVPVEVRQPEPTTLELLQRFAVLLLHPLTMIGITLLVAILILLQREDLRDRIIRLFGSRDLHRTTAAMNDAARRLSRFFITQLALNTAFGVWIAASLWLIGVPSPVLWGIFTAMMRFVPYIGAFVAALLPVALAAAVDPAWSMALWTIALFTISEPIMGHLIEPFVYGRSTGLSPFAVVVSAIFWTWLWGPIGLIIATPLTLCLVVLGRHVERLEVLDVLLGDRPALSPDENFYQRMLAGDPDEAMEQAEELLKEHSLSSYYDEVALRGLRLAANDAERRVLTPAQLERIKEAMKGLVNDLSAFHDKEPKPTEEEELSEDKDESPAGSSISEKALAKEPPVDVELPDASELPEAWRGEAPVMCIAGRGSLDEGPATMLAQLLQKHGLGARVVPHEAVSRSNIIGLDIEGVAMVCVSYLHIGGNPAHLRYFLRRLRQRLPDAPILVGLWPAEDPVLKDEALRGAIGADFYVTSLRDAVEACLNAAHRAAEKKQGHEQDEVQPKRTAAG